MDTVELLGKQVEINKTNLGMRNNIFTSSWGLVMGCQDITGGCKKKGEVNMIFIELIDY